MADNRTFRTGSGPSLGMRGTGSWTEAEQPDSYRKGILYLYPNGAAPLTALTAKARNVKEDNAHFHWFTKTLPAVGYAVGGVYTDPDLQVGNAYAPGTDAADGTVVHVQVSLEAATMTRVGHTVLLRQAAAGAVPTDHSNDVVGLVVNVQRTNDATSSIAVRLLQADGTGNSDLSDCNRFIIMGNSNPEGGSRPAMVSSNAVEWSNYMQIWRTPWGITETQRRTAGQRIGDIEKQLKREAMEDHSIQIEQSLIWGRFGWEIGNNGQPQRTTRGIVPFIQSAAPTHVVDFARDANYAGAAWVDVGKEWFDAQIYESFRLGKTMDRLVFCGGRAMSAIQRMVEANSMYQISQGESKYGIKVVTLETVHGNWHFKKHPLFAFESSTENSMLVIEPENIEFRYLRDTMMRKNIQNPDTDGEQHEFLTEAGLALYHPELFMYLSNVGVDNVV